MSADRPAGGSPPDAARLIGGQEGRLILRVRAAPGARRDRVVGVHGEALRVTVRAPPERGQANQAVLDLVARELGLRRTAVSLEGGAASRDKRLRIEGLSREELLRRLVHLLTGR